jgi:uncharacterized protein YdhG (YjbR/CyaY superfamily)
VQSSTGDRSAHFPKIEKKHGKPIAHWFKVLKELGDAKYPEQIALLRERYEFSQAHANAVVMYHRGSTSSKRHDDPNAYFKTLQPAHAKLAKAIFKAIQSKYPKLELVIAWNQPMLKLGDQYVFGVSASKSHILINPFSKVVLQDVSPRLKGLTASKHTVRIPLDWKVDTPLLHAMVRLRIKEIGTK